MNKYLLHKNVAAVNKFYKKKEKLKNYSTLLTSTAWQEDCKR